MTEGEEPTKNLGQEQENARRKHFPFQRDKSTGANPTAWASREEAEHWKRKGNKETPPKITASELPESKGKSQCSKSWSCASSPLLVAPWFHCSVLLGACKARKHQMAAFQWKINTQSFHQSHFWTKNLISKLACGKLSEVSLCVFWGFVLKHHLNY